MKDRVLDRFVKFDTLLGITAIVIALVAAFFSVYGIATLFAGAFLLTAVMASSLEVGKLVAVTFLYRYWEKTRGFLRTYLAIATVVLMLVTSMGIFGYLSAAYQKSAIEFKTNQEKIVMVESQKGFYTSAIAQSESRMKSLVDMRVMQEARLSEAMTNTFLSRNPLQLKQLQDQTITLINQANEEIKAENGQIRTNQAKIMSISEEVNQMKFQAAGKKDIQTFQFVAQEFGTTLDKVAKWFIFTLIFVFDPLAVALILAYNVATFKKEKDVVITPQSEISVELTNSDNSEKLPIVNPPEPSKEPVVETPPTDPPPAPKLDPGLDPGARRMFKL